MHRSRHRAPHTTHRRARLAFVGLILLTGCGPAQSVTVGVKDYATDILLAHAKPSVAPAPPVTPPPPPGFPFVPTPVVAAPPPVPVVPVVAPVAPVVAPVVPTAAAPVVPAASSAPRPAAAPTPQRGPSPVAVALAPNPVEAPVPPPVACPTAGALVGPAHLAPNRPSGPPAVRSYAYRVDGRYAITGAHPGTGSYPSNGSRRIHDVGSTADGTGYTFQETDDAGLTTSYLVYPEQVVAPQVPITLQQQPLPTQAGIYVTSFAYKRSDGSVLALTPAPALMVAKLPFTAGDRWVSKGVDATTGISVTVNGQTGLGSTFTPSRDRLDACGTVLDAYWVEFTVNTAPLDPSTQSSEPPSQISGPTIGIVFVGSKLAFGTAYGGFPIEEFYRLKGTDGGDTVDITRHAAISSEPPLATAR